MLADSVVTNEDYAKRAIELGHSVLSSCEHGNQGNYRECALLAEKYGLRWRYVSEAYFVKDRREKDNTNCHIILAAKTAKGVGDLNFVLSEANISGFYYRPRVDMELLLSLDPKDVFVTTACIAGVFKYGEEEVEKLILRFAQHFRNSFMLEVQYHDTEKQRDVNQFLLKLYRRHGIPLIMGTDSHFICPEDAALRQQRLEANHIRYEDESSWYMDYPSGAEAYRRFQKQGVLSDAQIREAIENTNIFLTFEDVVFDKSKKLPSIYPTLSQDERNQKYVNLIREEFKRQTSGMSEKEKAVRMKGVQYEMNAITSTGMSDYFLLDHEIVRRAVEKGGVITKTGRGSAPSYYTNSLLGLSSIDRFAIPVEMFPDRFISADRILSGSLPDIDMNVANREAFEQAQTEVLGEWRTAPMVAFGTLKRLSAWKMYCRAANIPFETANAVGNQLKAYETAVRYAEQGEEVDLSDFIPDQFSALVAASERYMGLIDSISPHPCAYLLCTEDIRREIGVIRINSKAGKKQPVFAAFIDGATAEMYGYLKNDMLLVDVVRTNQEAFERIGMKQPDVRELLDMTRGDADTWRMYVSMQPNCCAELLIAFWKRMRCLPRSAFPNINRYLPIRRSILKQLMLCA